MQAHECLPRAGGAGDERRGAGPVPEREQLIKGGDAGGDPGLTEPVCRLDRLVAPPGPTLVVLRLIGLDQLLRIYPTLGEAVAAGPMPNGQAAEPVPDERSTPGDRAEPKARATPEGNSNRAGLV